MAQNATYVSGYIKDYTTQMPLSSVQIEDINTKKWVITNSEGYFNLQVPSNTTIKLLVKLLGKEGQVIELPKNGATDDVEVFLKDKNLRLDEVVVTLQKGNDFSEIKIDQEVIQQVQAFSINEVLEQLPSQATTNLDLSEFKPIAFRTVRPSSIGTTGNIAFGNKSFGTSMVIDGIPFSNNENMQSYASNSGNPFSPNYIGFGESSANDFNGYVSNANYGVDLREITTENIESIEIVQGIPSAKYGDLTSGLIKIQQKAGKTPFKFYTSFREGVSEYGASKGFKLSNRLGHLNISANYLESNTDPRTSFMKYERINTNIMWGWNNAKNNIKNVVSIDYGFNKDQFNFDQEDIENRMLRNSKTDFAISNRLKWNFDDAFLDNLNFNAQYKVSNQNTYESKIINVGGMVVGTSTEEGIYEGTYTLPSYTTIKAIDGKPIAGFASLDVFKTVNTGTFTHNLTAGTEVRLSDNKGVGRLGAPESMSNFFGGAAGSVGEGFRPYNYGQNIRAEFIYSAYLEDNITKHWDMSSLHLNAGVRYDNFYGFSTLNPRINTSFSHDNFKIRGGFGLTSKAPSLNQIYTGPRYTDAVLGDYRYPGFYNIAVVQTFIDVADNKDLGPSKSLRTELGFDWSLPFAEINFTGFYNKLYDGITSEQYIQKRELANLQVNFDGTNQPTWEVAGFENYYFTQSRLTNKYESTDKGLEFMVSLDKIMPKNFSFGFNGSYIETTNFSGVDRFFRSTKADSEEVFGVFKPYESLHKHFRAGAYFNYHLPKIGLVIAVRSEHFFNDGMDYDYDSIPYAYIDTNLQKQFLSNQDIATGNYAHITGSEYYDSRDLEKVFHNFNLRISKDFFNGFRVSCYANNFLDLKQTRTTFSNGREVKVINSSIPTFSFGTRIEYQF